MPFMRAQTEDDFLRTKTTTVYESTHTVTDMETGELLRSEVSTKKRTSDEPDFIKVYYRAMMAVNELDEIPLSFLIALSAQIGFTNGDRILFYNNKSTRREIAEYCGIGDNMVQKYLRRCVTKGVLFTTQDRGVYEVNPWLIAKGKWAHIRELQANFYFVSGKWERRILRETDEE